MTKLSEEEKKRRHKEVKRRYYLQNKDKALEQQQQHHLQNKDKKLEQTRKHYAKVFSTDFDNSEPEDMEPYERQILYARVRDLKIKHEGALIGGKKYGILSR